MPGRLALLLSAYALLSAVTLLLWRRFPRDDDDDGPAFPDTPRIPPRYEPEVLALLSRVESP